MLSILCYQKVIRYAVSHLRSVTYPVMCNVIRSSNVTELVDYTLPTRNNEL